MQCYNKVDTISLEEVDRLARLPHSVVISCELEVNFDTLLHEIWECLSLLRVYTKKRGGTVEWGNLAIKNIGKGVWWE